MRDAQWAVDAVAVLDDGSPSPEHFVARLAEVVGTPASVESNRATVLALPVYLSISVLIACGLAGTELL